MKVFIKKISAFTLILALVLTGLFVLTNKLIFRGDYYGIPKGRTTLVLGHSHSACSLSDSLIPSFYNISQPCEGYPYSYFKAKKILENNEHIENIIIEYTNNQVKPWAHNRIDGLYLDINMPRTYPIVGRYFTKNVFAKSENLNREISTLTKTLGNNVNFLLFNRENYVDEMWHDHETPDHELSELPDEITSKDTSQNLDYFRNFYSIENQNMVYLLRLKQLCKEHGVKLYFIRSPMLETSTEADEMVYRHIKDFYFSDVDFLDFNDFPLLITDYADVQHVNKKGQFKISKFFQEELLDSAFWNKKDPGEFVKERIKLIDLQD